MKRFEGIFITVLLCLFCFSITTFSASIEDIQNQLKSGQGGAKYFPYKYGKGKRYQIDSLKVQPAADDKITDTFSDIKRDYAVHVVMKIRKLKDGEEQYIPNILKVHVFGKYRSTAQYRRQNELIFTLDEYVCKTPTNEIVRYFKDFKFDTPYHLFFLMDYNAYVRAKSYIAVIGTEGGEIIARQCGLGKIDDFEFPEDTELGSP